MLLRMGHSLGGTMVKYKLTNAYICGWGILDYGAQ